MTNNSENDQSTEYTPVEINLDTLLAAGAHFGHSVERWNPRMLPYIYGKKGDVHVINLDLTLNAWEETKQVINKAAADGANFLFVGTKEQARKIVKSAAERAKSFYVNNRWLGGTLTNYQTICKSINKMNNLENLLEQADDEKSDVKLGKKEKLQISRDLEKLSINLSGIRDMKRLPDYIFVIDTNRDSIAVEEARKLHIPVIALIDTNSDPSLVDYPIPTNDDSRAVIDLFSNAVADQVIAGRAEYERQNKQAQQQEADQQVKDESVAVEQARA